MLVQSCAQIYAGTYYDQYRTINATKDWIICTQKYNFNQKMTILGEKNGIWEIGIFSHAAFFKQPMLVQSCAQIYAGTYYDQYRTINATK